MADEIVASEGRGKWMRVGDDLNDTSYVVNPAGTEYEISASRMAQIDRDLAVLLNDVLDSLFDIQNENEALRARDALRDRAEGQTAFEVVAQLEAAKAERAADKAGFEAVIRELRAGRAEREKQKPAAWLDKSTQERPGDTVWLPDDLQGMSTRGLVPLYAAPPVITQHEPVTTVEDRYNADGKSCHITDDLPAGMPLYAAPPVAAPVRPNDSELEMIARAHGTGGWQTLGDMVTFARAIESAALRANGFKVEGEQ